MEASFDRATTCFFTGHRELPAVTLHLKKKLTAAVLSLYERGYKTFICGGALGFDTLAAETVLKLRSDHPDVTLFLMLPCLDQTRGWSESNRKRYDAVLSSADGAEWISREYARGCMHKRNRAMADVSSVCVAYLKKEGGGTAYTVDYANKCGLEIIHLA